MVAASVVLPLLLAAAMVALWRWRRLRRPGGGWGLLHPRPRGVIKKRNIHPASRLLFRSSASCITLGSVLVAAIAVSRSNASMRRVDALTAELSLQAQRAQFMSDEDARALTAVVAAAAAAAEEDNKRSRLRRATSRADSGVRDEWGNVAETDDDKHDEAAASHIHHHAFHHHASNVPRIIEANNAPPACSLECDQMRLQNEYFNYLLDDLENMHKTMRAGAGAFDADAEVAEVAGQPRPKQQQKKPQPRSSSAQQEEELLNHLTHVIPGFQPLLLPHGGIHGGIPKNIILNFKDKASIFTSDAVQTRLLRQNVARIAARNPGWRVLFDDDAGCLELTMATGVFAGVGRRRIAQWFAGAPGRLRSDLCRLAQLQAYGGGVYIDNDLELVEPLDTIFAQDSDSVSDTFVSVWSAPVVDVVTGEVLNEDVIFQAFMAASEVGLHKLDIVLLPIAESAW